MNAMRPSSEPSGAASSAAKSAKRTISASTSPPGLPPSAVTTSGCACAPTTRALSLLRTQRGKVTGSVQTRS